MSPPRGPSAEAIPGLVDHLFRRQAGALVARLTGVLGDVGAAEEVVQETLVLALRLWPVRGVPDDPPAWLAGVARNRALDRLRRAAVEARAASRVARPEGVPDDPVDPDRLGDEELALVFLCCHPELTPEDRVALTLKAALGLGVGEVARALLSTPGAVARRLARAKERLRQRAPGFELPSADELPARLDAVLEAVYLTFNAGHVAAEGDALVRTELCAEALRLAELLVARPEADRPETQALLALMELTAARLPARLGRSGELVLLADQDRGRWDRALIARGLRRLDAAARGSRVTRYHLEAGIAACHAAAPTANATDWAQILSLYDHLQELAPSPVVALNRAVVLAELEGPEAALRALRPLERHMALADYHLLPATLAELWRRRGRSREAARCYRQALTRPCSEPERRWLERRLAEVSSCRSSGSARREAARPASSGSGAARGPRRGRGPRPPRPSP